MLTAGGTWIKRFFLKFLAFLENAKRIIQIVVLLLIRLYVNQYDNIFASFMVTCGLVIIYIVLTMVFCL